MDGDSVVIPDNPAGTFAIYDGGTINFEDLSVGRPGLIPGDGAIMSVAGSFQWTAGSVTDGGTIRIDGQGVIAGGPPGPFLGAPNLNNDCALDVTGTVTITGPGSLTIGGGQCSILNAGTITLDQSGLYWDAGAPPLITNNGTITTIGTVTLEGGDVTNLGTATISAGSELVLRGGAVFRLAGGQVTGTGTLHPADDGGDTGTGTVSVEAVTVLPAGLTLNLSGFGQVTTPLPQQANPPILTIDGTLNLNGGTVNSSHIVISRKGQCTISGTTSSLDGGELDNLSVITLLPGAVWSLDGGAQLKNNGRISLQGGNSLSVPDGFANMTNAGLIDSGGTTPNQISSLPVSNTGNIAVREGILNLVSDAALTVASGSVFLSNTTLDSSDSAGALTLTGGTAGGVLRGTGNVGAAVTNGGWIEPADPGLLFTGNFSQSSGGSLALPSSALGSAAQPLLSLNGPSPSLGGSLWCLMSDSAAPAAANLINVSAAPSGQFTKVRVGDDDTRLILTYPAAEGAISAQEVPAPGYYGLDFSAYPAGTEAASQLQDLFDNTPFSYLGFYFKTTGHPGGSWHGKAQALLDQGWALLPIYVGRQQVWRYKSDNAISTDIPTATQQGQTDGNNAVSLARGEGIPSGSLIFLDIEPPTTANDTPVAVEPQTYAYIDAWLSTVGASDYVAALYDGNAHWTKGKTTYYESVVIHDTISSDPDTWVSWSISIPPSGVTTNHWPLDDNGDVCPIAVKRYAQGHRWDFATFAKVWQFKTDWPPAAATIITDKGTAYPLSQIIGKDKAGKDKDVDFNTSISPDPAHTNGSRTKKERRAKVTGISAANASLNPGATTTLTVTLDRNAPSPNGTAVLLRCDSRDVTIPSASRVPGGTTTVNVTVAAVVGASGATVNVSSRTVYQLTGAPATTTLTITTS